MPGISDGDGRDTLRTVTQGDSTSGSDADQSTGSQSPTGPPERFTISINASSNVGEICGSTPEHAVGQRSSRPERSKYVRWLSSALGQTMSKLDDAYTKVKTLEKENESLQFRLATSESALARSENIVSELQARCQSIRSRSSITVSQRIYDFLSMLGWKSKTETELPTRPQSLPDRQE